MKTKQQFDQYHPELNKAQLTTAYHLVEVADWRMHGLTLTKNGINLTLTQEGNAL